MNESVLRLVILALAGIACLSIAGIIVVSAVTHGEAPQILGIIATAATTGISAILVNPREERPGVIYVPAQVSPGLPPPQTATKVTK